MSDDSMPATDAGLLTAEQLSTAVKGGSDMAQWHALAIEMITRYLGDDAAACPVAVRNEAMIRITGHGIQTQSAAVLQDSIGPLTLQYPDDRRGLLKRSGAESILSPYKTRGAGIIG